MAILSNLYPPIIDTYMPAFVASVDGNCKIYFSLSNYNVEEDIKSIWVTVNNQYTNESVLKTDSFPAELKVTNELLVDGTRTGDDKYYVVINNSDIKDGWALNQLYKVQIRFCSKTAPQSNEVTMNWIVENEASFSEWSTVCLIQGINQPTLLLKNFQESLAGNETIFTAENNTIAGSVSFDGGDDELESYQFYLYDRNNLEVPVFDSGIVYTSTYNPNEINYFLNYAFTDGEQYLMKFTYTTKSLYTETQEFAFSIINSGGELLNAYITAEQNEEEGCITIHVKSDSDRFFGNLTIRRASSETNFAIWEDVLTTPIISEDFLDYVWEDYTVESGVWYKYGVQKRNSYGDRGLLVTVKNPVMVTLQDMFLTRANQQLKIKFNPQVSGYSHTLSESLTQTLGSKYPFIKRNANVNYRQFSISGLISHFCDENNLFISEDELYKQRKDLYLEYNDENRITEYNDFTLERTFREKVQEFLYANNAKLFRSPSEGNILVRLMNVSFSPEQTLGRMVYSFSATAYEIDAPTFENYEKYGIQKVGTYSKYITDSYEKTSQISGSFTGDLYSTVQKLEEQAATDGLTRKVRYFTNVQLAIESKPYLIGTTQPDNPKILTENDHTDRDTVLGYLIYIDNRPVIIGPNGRYNVAGEDTQLTSLRFPEGVSMDVTLDYTCIVDETEDTSSLARQVYYTSRVGQLWGYSRPTVSIAETIADKYTTSNSSWYQRIFGINSLKIEADPNTIFYIKDSSLNSTYKRYIIGDTGYLNIESPDYSISDIYCYGTYLTEKQSISKNVITKDLEFVRCSEEGIYNNFGELLRKTDAIKNGVYFVAKKPSAIEILKETFESSKNAYLLMLNNKIQPYTVKINGEDEEVYRVIYFQDNWYLFSSDNEVIKPCQVLIDYYYELERGEY